VLTKALMHCGFSLALKTQLGEISQWQQHANTAFSTNMLGHTSCWMTPTWKIYSDKMCVNNTWTSDQKK